VEGLARQGARRELTLVILLQWLHVLFAIFWFGSQMYSDLSLRPAMSKLPPEATAPLQQALGIGTARRITVVVATGTVLLGTLRGIIGGVLGVLDTAYGLTWLAALAIGMFMVFSIWTRGFGGRIHSLLWNGLFVVMFTLMIAMRFGY
jgi:uncharacterized membrane protein